MKRRHPALWASRGGRLLLGLVVLYGSACLYAWLFYPKVLYPAPPLPAHAPLPSRCEVLELHDGQSTVRALRWKGQLGRPTLVWFHGNGELVDGLLPLGERFVERGFGFTMMEYRGYGRSSGARPSEGGLYADADALLRHLSREPRGPGELTIAVGYSLGSGVVAEMAVRRLADRFVLVSPFTSMTDMASRLVPLLPARLILSERFDTLSKAARVHDPLLVVHGAQDELVPFDMGYAVAGAVKGAKLVTVPDGHHADVLYASDAMALDAIEKFASAP